MYSVTSSTVAFLLALVAGLSCLASTNARLGGLYTIETPVYKTNSDNTWIEGSVANFEPSTGTYTVLWSSDMSIEEIDPETATVYVGNQHLFEEVALVQDGDEELLMQEHYEEEALIESEQESFGGSVFQHS